MEEDLSGLQRRRFGKGKIVMELQVGNQGQGCGSEHLHRKCRVVTSGLLRPGWNPGSAT